MVETAILLLIVAGVLLAATDRRQLHSRFASTARAVRRWQFRRMTREEGRAIQCMSIINKLRSSEGWGLELVCDNPDFGGPNCLVNLYGEWDGRWCIRTFHGDDLLSALRNAYAAYQHNQSHGREAGWVTTQ